MNRLTSLILVFLLAGTIGVKAQTETAGTPAASYGLLENKLEKTDKDKENPKKNVTAKYWLSRADVMMDAYEINYKNLRLGGSELEMQLMFGNPTEKLSEVVEGVEQITNVHERVNITYVNGAVSDFEETKPLHENALVEAKAALAKAVELDTENKLKKKLGPAHERLIQLFVREGVVAFGENDFAGAFANFEDAVALRDVKVLEGTAVDTLVMYNAGMAAARAEMNEESVKYYELARSHNYPVPELYVNLKKSYTAMGDTAKGVELLTKGFELYPGNQTIVIELINYYLTADKGEEALNYINIALEGDSENTSLIFAKGVLFDKQGEYEKAVATYESAIAIDAEFFNGYYNLGISHFNKAQKLYDEAGKAKDDAEYDALIAKGDETLKLAIPNMQKCYELDPTETTSMETLKNIYYRLKMMDKYEEAKALLQ